MVTIPPAPFKAESDPRQDPRIADPTFKKRFAALQLREPGKDIHHALGMIPEGNIAQAAVNAWNIDPEVAQERLRLQTEFGQRAELPTKEDIMLEVLAIGRDGKHSVADRLKSYTLYSELNGYTGRNVPPAASVNIFANKVMALKDHGGAAKWEDAAVKQQSDLVQAARDDAKRSETAH